MKILAFTDLHLSSIALKKLKSKVEKLNPDLLVCAGDISIFEEGLDQMLSKLNKFKKRIILVNGNHEEDNVMNKFCKKYNNIVFIHKKSFIEDNVLFLGYGGGGFSKVDPDFYPTGEKFSKIIEHNEGKKAVFVTHAPPYGTKVDLIIGEHCGNKTFSKFIKKNKIDLHVCGHLHENFNKKDNIKKTRIINPGPYGEIVNL